MPTFYVDGSTGSDNNSGAPLTAVANGTAATRSTNVYTLDGTPNLSSITVNEDTIRINGETSGNGSTGDMFTITAFDDGADTVTVSPTPTGGTSGLTWYIGGPFATIDRAMNSVAQGDIVYVKATGTYSEEPALDTAGLVSDAITFEGYSSTPGDNGKVTISGATTGLKSGSLTSSSYYVFKNFKFNGHSGNGVNCVNNDQIAFYNCEFNNNGGRGCLADETLQFVNCVATGNLGNGLDGDGACSAIGCIVGNNGGYGIQFNGFNARVYRCLVYGVAASQRGINCTSAGVIIGNTIDGENNASNYGIYQSDSQPYVVDNIVYDCNTGVRLDTNTGEDGVVGYNLLNSNNTNYTTYDASLTHIGWQDVTSAPGFTDEAGDDYTLADDSPAINAGLQPGGIT